jgi:alpha-1,3-rhamnosyl/mannosyltransferase
LTVAVDVAAYWEPLTGVGRYLDSLLRHLADRDDLRLRLYGERMIDGPWARQPAAPLPEGSALEEVRYPLPPVSMLASRPLHPVLSRLRSLLIAADANRLVFAPNFYPPRRFLPALLTGRASLVATVHDLAYLRHPETVAPATRELLSRRMGRVFFDAAAILTPSEAVRGEIVAAGLAPASRVRAVHHGPGGGDAGRPGAGGAHPPDWAPERYALFVGTLEPRKGVDTLLAAWRRLRRAAASSGTGLSLPDLVLVGGPGWMDEALARSLEVGVSEGWLHRPGYVSGAELAALYRAASLLAAPSLYEGFGLPLLEALAAGTPVVASDLPVFREVAGDAALYAPPGRPDRWAEQIARLLADPALAARLAEGGRERAAAFRWERAAEETAEAFHAAAAEEVAR